MSFTSDTWQFHKRVYILKIVNTEVATGGALYKKVFLKISENSQEIISVRASFLIKSLDPGTGVFVRLLRNF